MNEIIAFISNIYLFPPCQCSQLATTPTWVEDIYIERVLLANKDPIKMPSSSSFRARVCERSHNHHRYHCASFFFLRTFVHIRSEPKRASSLIVFCIVFYMVWLRFTATRQTAALSVYCHTIVYIYAKHWIVFFGAPRFGDRETIFAQRRELCASARQAWKHRTK